MIHDHEQLPPPEDSAANIIATYAPRLHQQTLARVDAGVKAITFAKSHHIYGAIAKVQPHVNAAPPYFDLAKETSFKYHRSERLSGLYNIVKAEGSTIPVAIKRIGQKVATVHSSPASDWVILQRTTASSPTKPNPLIYFYRGPRSVG